MTRSTRLLVLLLLATPVPAIAQPVEWLPVRNPAYEEIEALSARGMLDSLPVYTRPVARVDVARALLRAARRDSTVRGDAHFQRLEREVARELADLEGTEGATLAGGRGPS